MPDLLQGNFGADAPNSVYVGGVICLLCGGGRNLYLATVIDCFSRRLVGWSITDHMPTKLVTEALSAAAAERGSLTALCAIFHSAQHTSRAYADLCTRLGVSGSMGAVGSSGPATLRRSRATPSSSGDPRRRPRLGQPRSRPPRGVRLDHTLRHPPPAVLGQTSPITYENSTAAPRCQSLRRHIPSRGQGQSRPT
ncbi:DDE-type integrase/transposase/recombinase [Blastococcus capsensis]|uniref:DDE-type integrase/transposase/recombinase n=1 Tax=Blastococcus capsensis TaxID=1564163 RepID=UPI00253F7A94|nr:DDE-type integrase/transposase/recombinase [Blastococcus capsensis]MDK3255440.1 DDE-type integrase/transposase/recombinase [Blastococcus capsensis]